MSVGGAVGRCVVEFACSNNDGLSDELIAARHTKACRPNAATFLVWQEWSPIQQGDNKLRQWTMPNVHCPDDISIEQF